MLAQIVASGFDEALLPILRFSPRYGPVLQGLSVSDLAQRHQRIFGFDISPVAGAFLDPKGRVGGPLSDQLTENLIAIGAKPDAGDFEPEALAEQLALLSRLVGGEVEGWENERPEEWQGFQLAQGLVLHQHLMPWLPPLVVALSMQSERAYQVLGEEIWSCSHGHLADLDPRCDGYQTSQPAGRDGGGLLSAPETGLAQIAAFLVRPLDSGWYLSRSDLAAVAAEAGASLAPGSRQQMMEDLLYAVELESLVQTLAGKVDAWSAAYAALAAPNLIRPWGQRLHETRQMIAGLGAAT